MGIVALGIGNAVDAGLQAFAQGQHRFNGLPALGISGVFQQFLRQCAGSANLLQRKLLSAAGDIVIHFQVYITFKVLTEAGGFGNIAADGGILQIGRDQHHEDKKRNRQHGQKQA